MKRFVLAIALACVLSVSALAGEVHSVGAPAPGNTPTGGAPAPGDQGNGGLADDGNQGGGNIVLLILDLLF